MSRTPTTSVTTTLYGRTIASPHTVALSRITTALLSQVTVHAEDGPRPALRPSLKFTSPLGRSPQVPATGSRSHLT